VIARDLAIEEQQPTADQRGYTRIRDYGLTISVLADIIILGWFTNMWYYQTYVQNLSIDNSLFFMRY
jgi:hypothetical protein